MSLVRLFGTLALFTLLITHTSASSSLPVTYIPNYGTPKTTQYSGYLDLLSQRGRLFHWFFEREDSDGLSEQERREIPVTIWLNGGPGCSSFTGLLEENGPYRFIGESFDLEDYEHTWQRDAHMLYIDQPVGTGLSHVDMYVTSELQVAEDMYSALLEFYRLHPEYEENPLYITGESYFGKYGLSIAKYILDQNKVNEFQIPLHGIALGNALMHPLVQRIIKADQIYNHQLVSFEGRQVLDDLQLRCAAHIQNQNLYPNEECDTYHHYFTVSSGGINQYDLRRFTDTTNRTRREIFLNQPDVREALHAPFEEQPEFVGCSNKVSKYLQQDVLKSLKYIVPELVKSGIRVLLFAGNMDLKDGPVGVEQMLHSSSFFVNELGFKQWRRDLWVNPQGEVAGYVKSKDNFTFLVLHGAGHFVPTDQGANARDMFQRFISGTPFCSGERVRLRNLRESEVPRAKGKRSRVSRKRSLEYSCNAVAAQLCEKTTTLDGAPCSGHGQCTDGGFCHCDNGWTGTHCGWNSTVITMNTASEGLSSYLLNQHWHFVKSDLPGVVMGNIAVEHHPSDGNPDKPVRAAFGKPLLSMISNIYSPAYMEEKMLGEGLGTDLPWNKICIYGRKKAEPTHKSFHFVHCLEDDETEGVFMTPKAQSDEWQFGIFNGLPHPVDIQVKFSQEAPEEPKPRCSLTLRLACIFFQCSGVCV